jgi:hypothetical protein
MNTEIGESLVVISKVHVPAFLLVLRAHFLIFLVIFALFLQFRPFLEPDFSFFCFFSTSRDGILARKMPPCITAHPKTVLRYNVCPRLDPEKSL